MNGSLPRNDGADGSDVEREHNGNGSPVPNGNGVELQHPQHDPMLETNDGANSTLSNNIEEPITSAKSTEDRVDALLQERTALRDEVIELRRSLEQLRVKHEEDIHDVQGEKEQAESQYRDLRGKVNNIKSMFGERLKADAEDLAQARNRIGELEEENGNLREQNDTREAELATLAEEGEQRSKELSSLRNRTTLSQQNWAKERDDLLQREAYAKEEFEAAKQAMQDWEVLAMEERSIRESISEKVADLEEQVVSHREAHERAASDRDSQSLTVDGLQRALQEIQEGRLMMRVAVYACLQLNQQGEGNYEKLSRIRKSKSNR